MREFKLDTNARLSPDSPRPKYPDALRGSGKDGRVLAQVIVGRDGRAEPASLRLARDTTADAALIEAVRTSIPTLQFEPATVEGNKVKQLVSLTYFFNGTNASSDVIVNILQPTSGSAAPRKVGNTSASAPTPSTPGQIYFDFQVERPVVMAPGSVGPKYPDDLRTQKVEGTVLAQFAVGPDGRAEMSTFKVLKTSDPRFAESVREALSVMQFSPAEIGGQKVRQLVQQPFQFALSN